METVTAKDARPSLGTIINRALFGGQPTLLTRNGRAAAVVVSPSWYEQHRGADDPSTSVVPVRPRSLRRKSDGE